MVWAVKFESEYGRFFVGGDYAELREGLNNYFFQTTQPEERAVFKALPRYTVWVFDKFTNEIGEIRPNGDPTLTPLKDHEWPRNFRARLPIKGLGSLFKTINRVLTVDQDLKDLIEDLEPGVHQFRPLTVLQPNSDQYPGRYFTLVIGRFLDSFVPEETPRNLWHAITHTDKDGNEVATGRYDTTSREEYFADLAFSSSVIGGAHLWRERRLPGRDFFMSDTLRDAIRKAKMKIAPHLQAKEV